MVYILLFFIGLAVGSFLNTVCWRLHTGQNLLVSRSHCPGCKKVLAWYDLIPLLSFSLTYGRCRYCGKKISWQYPLVELSTGVLFVLVGWWIFEGVLVQPLIDYFIILLFYYFIVSVLIVIFVYDLKHFIIPDKVIYPAIIIAFGYQLIKGLWLNSLIAALLAAGLFLALVLVSYGKWMGLGDVKLACFMGLVLGWPNILAAIIIAFVLGGIVGIILIFAKKKILKSEIPFGPFLSAATLISIFWGEKLINWYLNFIGY